MQPEDPGVGGRRYGMKRAQIISLAVLVLALLMEKTTSQADDA